MSSVRKRTIASVADAAEKLNVPPPLVSKTISWLELLDWQQDNEYITHGYRRAQFHWKGCLESVYAYIHNETVNIHSHLFGAFLFIYLLSAFGSHLEPHSPTWVDSTMFSVFLSCAVFCLSASAIFHTSSCHSREVSRFYHTWDYVGIIVMIVGSFYPCIYYGFSCEPMFQVMYIISITALGSGAAYIVLSPEYSKPTHRGLRTGVFIALGLSAIIPVSHWMSIQGVTVILRDVSFRWLVTSGALYIIGALLYANRIPERFAPGMFDYFFASHQIFHVCVVLAALAHYASILAAFKQNYTSPRVCNV